MFEAQDRVARSPSIEQPLLRCTHEVDPRAVSSPLRASLRMRAATVVVCAAYIHVVRA